MTPKANTDLSILPRPFTTVADLIHLRTGVRISSQSVQQCHDRAIAKLRRALSLLAKERGAE